MIEVTIQGKHEQKLLHRSQVDAKVSFDDIVPSRLEVRKLLAQKVGKPESQVIIHKILPTFGSGVAVIKADVYEDADAMKHLVDKFTTIRHMPKEEQAKVKDEMKAAKQAAKAAKIAAKKK